MAGDYRFTEAQWIRDEVTVSGEMYRQDWPIRAPEGVALYEQLIQEFPDEANAEINLNALESIGLNAAGVRAAYQNDTISWYGSGNIPQRLRDEYKIDGPQYLDGTRNWYGKKYDLVTKEIMIKAAVPLDDTPVPDGMLKGAHMFLGKLYRKTGMDPSIDYYVITPSYAELAYFCGKFNLMHDVTAQELKNDPGKFCFSVVYDINTLTPTELKVYRFFVYGS